MSLTPDHFVLKTISLICGQKKVLLWSPVVIVTISPNAITVFLAMGIVTSATDGSTFVTETVASASAARGAQASRAAVRSFLMLYLLVMISLGAAELWAPGSALGPGALGSGLRALLWTLGLWALGFSLTQR